MKIIAYTYDADVHCIGCARDRFATSLDALTLPMAVELDANNIPFDCTDKEGNEVHPIFSTDEQLEPLSCGDCHELIIEPTRSRQPVTLLVGEL